MEGTGHSGRAGGGEGPSPRAVLRTIGVVVGAALALYAVYLLRTPLTYVLLAAFVAVAVAGPVDALGRHMSRGLAIATVYAGIVLAPFVVAAILVPPAVRAGIDLVNELPRYAGELEQTFQENGTLRDIDEKFSLTDKISELASDASAQLDDAAIELANIGAGFVGLIFALVMILVMSVFMVSRGGRWLDPLIDTRPPAEAESIRRALGAMALAVGSYIGGALAQATIAGAAAFVVLTVLGVDSALALAVVMGLFDLIPLVGATIGAIIVALVTLFTDFPTATIVWVVFAIAYQQFENYVIQPRIQSRAVELDPFFVVIAALFGGTLFGVLGALLAIPGAASIQIGVRELLAYRRARDAELSPAAGGARSRG